VYPERARPPNRGLDRDAGGWSSSSAAAPPPPSSSSSSSYGPSGGAGATQAVPKLYVGNLTPEVNEERLTNFFSKFGKVVDALIVKDRDDHKSRGFGFVTFEHEVCLSVPV
jgi:RNA recognition motif-containing protein